MKAALPPDETQRISALHEYRILDTLPEAAYDEITHLASTICAAPIALITLIDRDRQWFKSVVGVDLRETPRDVAFCAHAILEADLVVVPDLTLDSRFADNPFVADGPRFRFYAGAPLITPDGRGLGTLCVVDTKPRELGDNQRDALRALSRQVIAQLELRRHILALEQSVAERSEAEERLRTQAEQALHHQAVLTELAKSRETDLDSALRTITKIDAETLGVERVSVWFFTSDQGELVCHTLFTLSDGAYRAGVRLESKRLPRYFAALHERRVIAAHDAVGDPNTSEFAEDYLKPLGITSMLDVPIWRHGEMTGVVCHEHTGPHRRWTPGEQDFAASIADMVSLALEAAERQQAEAELQIAYAELERRVEERTAELKRSEEYARSILENTSDILTVLDRDGVLLYQSPALQRELGWRPEDLLGRNAFDQVHPDDVVATRAQLVRVLANPGKTYSATFRYRRRDGQWRILEAFGRTVSTDSDAHGVVVNSRDITERKRAEDDLRLQKAMLEASEVALRQAKEEAEAAREAAEAANRAKSEFLSRMSHELRTPMNSILGFAQLLAKRDLAPEYRRALDHILKAGEHLLNLINEVLDIARIEANRQQLSLEPVRVSHAVHEALNLIRPLAAQRHVQVTEDVDIEDDPYVRADRQRLAQVLLNLLSNAVKYNRPGGLVWLTCNQTIDGQTGEERFSIGVHDTGVGIATDKLGQLFVPFARLGAEQTEVEGTGLGLALSQRLVEAMGGHIRVESVPGQGSAFHVELRLEEAPLERLRRVAASLAPSDTQLVGGPASILYIEDNLANLALVEAILANRPVKLMPALQGQLGIDLAVEHRPDVVLLDLHLPDMLGDEVLRRLQADPRTHDTPVVIITADATDSSIQRLMDAGARAYITKPLDVDEFLGALDEVLKEVAAE